MEIEKILILVETADGAPRQVLASKQNKEIALQMLGRLEGGIKLTTAFEPIELRPLSEREPILTHICQDCGKYFDGLDYDHAQCGRCGNQIAY
jgi:hypothetical protein